MAEIGGHIFFKETEMESDHDGTVCKYHYGVMVKLEEAEKALNMARQTLERRLEGMNEFRAQLKEQAGTFIIRSEFMATMERWDREIKNLNRAKDLVEGKASVTSVYLALLVGLLSIFISIINLLKP